MSEFAASLSTPIEIHGGDAAAPVRCTVAELWNDNPELDYGEIQALLDEIGRPGGAHVVGGGAAATFTVRKARPA